MSISTPADDAPSPAPPPEPIDDHEWAADLLRCSHEVAYRHALRVDVGGPGSVEDYLDAIRRTPMPPDDAATIARQCDKIAGLRRRATNFECSLKLANARVGFQVEMRLEAEAELARCRDQLADAQKRIAKLEHTNKDVTEDRDYLLRERVRLEKEIAARGELLTAAQKRIEELTRALAQACHQLRALPEAGRRAVAAELEKEKEEKDARIFPLGARVLARSGSEDVPGEVIKVSFGPQSLSGTREVRFDHADEFGSFSGWFAVNQLRAEPPRMEPDAVLPDGTQVEFKTYDKRMSPSISTGAVVRVSEPKNAWCNYVGVVRGCRMTGNPHDRSTWRESYRVRLKDGGGAHADLWFDIGQLELVKRKACPSEAVGDKADLSAISRHDREKDKRDTAVRVVTDAIMDALRGVRAHEGTLKRWMEIRDALRDIAS